MTTSVYVTPNGSIYVQLASGAFRVIRPDGGEEERFTLPASAVRLVDSRYFEDVA